MNIIVDIIGILGFILGVFVFVLTRWEKRKRVAIELFRGDLERIDPDYTQDDVESGCIIGFRVVNLGFKAIAIDRNSVTISGNNRIIDISWTDWIGLDKIPAPLNPGTNFEVGMFVDAFESILGAHEFKKFFNKEDSDKCIITITAAFKDVEGKFYSSKNKYQYSFYASEFYPAQHVGS